MTIKSLLVKIGADVTGLEAGLKKAEGYLESHKQQFKQVGMAVTVAGAAITGAVGTMISKYISAGDTLLDMSKRTGMSVTALSELKFAASLCGADINTVELAVKRMAKALIDASEGSAEYVDAFARINLTAAELMGLSPEQQFDRISRAIANLEDPTLRAATAQEIFGRSGTQLLPLLSEGAAGLDAMRQKAHEVGVAFDEEAAQKASDLDDAIVTLKASFSGVGNTVATALAPVITSLATTISNVITKVQAWMAAHPGLTSVLVKVVTVLGILGTVLGPIIMMLPLLASGFAILTGPIGIAVAAIMGIIAIGTLLMSHWGTIKQFISDTWDAIKLKTTDIWDAIKNFLTGVLDTITGIFSVTWEAIKTAISNAFDFIKNLASTAWETITGIFGAANEALFGCVGDLVQKIVDKFMWLFNKVKEITTWIKDHTIGIFKKMWDKVSGHSIVPEMVASVIGNFLSMKTSIGTTIDELQTKVKDVFDTIKTNTTTAIQETTDTAQTLFGNITDYAQAMSSDSSDAYRNMGDALKGQVRAMLDTLEKNAIAFIITKVMAALPFPVNLIAVAAAIAAVKLLFSRIKLAEGGIVTRPTYALIGERGPEAVIPLNSAGGFGLGGGVTLRQNNYFYGDISNVGDIDEISRRLAERTTQAISKGRRY